MFARLIIACLVLLTLNCKPKPSPGETGAVASKDIPKGILIEKEISGSLLGLNLNQPGGLAGGDMNVIYLVDEGNNRLIRFDSNLVPRADTKGYGGSEGMLDRPAYAWLDNDLNLVVADVGNRRLVWYDRQLHYADEIEMNDEEDPLKFGSIVSVGITEYGQIWGCDWEMGRIALFENNGQFESFVGDFGYSGGQLLRPEKIVADRNNGFYVCDAGNRRVVHYDGYGNYQGSLRDELFDYPISMALARNGHWVLDGTSGRLFYYDSKERSQFVTGPMIPGSNTPLSKPSDIIILPDDRLLISDTGNNRLILCHIYYD